MQMPLVIDQLEEQASKVQVRNLSQTRGRHLPVMESGGSGWGK